MNISCVLYAKEVVGIAPHIVVFPEGVCANEIMQACENLPASIIVGAIEDAGDCRGILVCDGQNRIDYLKVGSDGNTAGSGNIHQMPVYEFSNLCIGVLICMDIDCTEFFHSVVNRVKASTCDWKLLCIPADMGSEWLGSDTLPTQYHGIHVILCNHTKSHPQDRRPSFVADPLGKKVAVQSRLDPLHVCVTPSLKF